MTFNETLNQYITDTGCTSKELSDISGISIAALSRYRSGTRTPDENSEILQKLASALASLSKSRALTDQDHTSDQILLELRNAIVLKSSDSTDTELFVRNFNTLIKILDIKVNLLARFTSYDPSFISRIRQGQRLPADPAKFAASVSAYAAKKCNSDEDKTVIEELTGCREADLADETSLQMILTRWLISGNTENKDTFTHFLQKMDEFDLNEYIRAIHFDELKVPAAVFQLPTSKYYYGIKEMMESEVEFLKSTVLSKSAEPVIMYSDMPLAEMSRDPEFPKKWMTGIGMMLKKGLHLHQIHNIDRPFEEMMLGLESWIPMYMTGQVSPYYFKGVQNNVFLHLLQVSGSCALSGEAISDAQGEGRYYLTKNREEVSYFRKRAKRLLKKARPLMDVYRSDTRSAYKAFITAESKLSGNRRNILSAPPLYTMPEDLIKRILKRTEINNKDTADILRYADELKSQMQMILEQKETRSLRK